jgi:uncharacterized protein YjbI with pentapeptide repeats
MMPWDFATAGRQWRNWNRHVIKYVTGGEAEQMWRQLVGLRHRPRGSGTSGSCMRNTDPETALAPLRARGGSGARSLPVHTVYRLRSLDGCEVGGLQGGVLDVVGGFWRRGDAQHCTTRDCVLDAVRLRKISLRECSVARAKIGPRAQTTVSDARAESCTFADLKIRRALFVKSAFTECQFSGGEVRDSTIESCVLKRVSHTGVLRKVTFGDCLCEAVDLSEAELIGCTFVGCNMAEVKLPSRPDNFAVPRSAVIAATDDVRGRMPPDEQE